MPNLLREEAKRQGLTTYEDTRSCPRGHGSIRYVSSNLCRTCSKNRANQQHRERGTLWYHTNKEKASEHKAEFEQYTVLWRRANLDKLTKNAGAYRASKLQATPSWADHGKIQQFYTEAQRLTKETGIKYTVDHQIPLNSDLVCGLHVEHNLQLLTLSENSAKGNRL